MNDGVLLLDISTGEILTGFCFLLDEPHDKLSQAYHSIYPMLISNEFERDINSKYLRYQSFYKADATYKLFDVEFDLMGEHHVVLTFKNDDNEVVRSRFNFIFVDIYKEGE